MCYARSSRYVAQILGAKVVILLPEADRLVLKAGHPADTQLTAAERAAATWAWQHNQTAGRGTDTLPGGRVVLPAAQHSTEHGGSPRPAIRDAGAGHFPRSAAAPGGSGRAGRGGNRTHAIGPRDGCRARLLTETERLRDALLSTISHDLRTPLVSIIGAVSSLLTYGATYEEKARRGAAIDDSGGGGTPQPLRRQSARYDAPGVRSARTQREWVEIGDVIGTALARLATLLSQHQLVVEVEPELPMLQLDFVLMEHVLVNLLENAAKYSPPQTSIRVSARQTGRRSLWRLPTKAIGMPAADAGAHLRQVLSRPTG